MTKLKRILIITVKAVAALLLLLLLGYGFISYSLERRFQKVYAIPTAPLQVTANEALLAQGAHLYKIKGCEDCHSADLGGKFLFEDKLVGRFVGANITYGKGGLPQDYTAADWQKALRHGLGKDNKPLLMMPSHELYMLSDQDMKAVIAYCMSQKPVDRSLPGMYIGPLGKVLTAFGKITLIPAESIDHNFVPLTGVEAVASTDYGKYLSVSCTGCHHVTFKGGEAAVPGMPPIPDITRTGRVGNWTEAQFVRTLRTGKTPDGRQLLNENMPWQMTKAYTDTELKALYLFLRSQ